MSTHFGLSLRASKYGLKMTRENYATINNRSSFKRPQGLYKGSNKDLFTDETMKYYSEAFCQEHYKRCMENYDLNIKFFQQLDHNKFNTEIESFRKKHKYFISVQDLSQYESVPGYYIMVLDEYCQLYIGNSTNIKKRIQQHWSKKKEFDRLIFGRSINVSRIAIDSFRALDTTRIYAYSTKDLYTMEDEFISAFSDEFLCNRLDGGKIPENFLEILEMMKLRELK